uniref:CSON014667 protein n=1 Tax=Culicoides sonorensis TaxID=179676 RepID=A0A336MFK5_CULSO
MSEEAFNKSTFHFTKNLFKELIKHFKSNDFYAYSPLSIQSCITMLYMGAEGETADSIAEALHYNENFNKIEVASLIKILMENGEEEESIEYANGLLVDSNLKISDFYQKLMKTYFHSNIDKMDGKNDENTVKNVNQWIQGRTHGKIKDIISKMDLVNEEKKERKKFILLDAIYFKGRWAYEFNKTLTKPAKFWYEKDNFVTVDMMEVTNHFNYCRIKDHKLSVLELNYIESELSLLIILPDDSQQLETLDELADQLSMFDIVTMMYLKTVQVFLPKFSLEFTLDLKTALANMGMSRLFEFGYDLKGIFDFEENPENVFIDSVYHKTMISVDEEGARAKDEEEELGDVEIVFRVDKPFLFCLKHKWEHNIIISGFVRKV